MVDVLRHIKTAVNIFFLILIIYGMFKVDLFMVIFHLRSLVSAINIYHFVGIKHTGYG